MDNETNKVSCIRANQDTSEQTENIIRDAKHPLPPSGDSPSGEDEILFRDLGVTGGVPDYSRSAGPPSSTEIYHDKKGTLTANLSDELALSAEKPRWKEVTIHDTQVAGLGLRMRRTGFKTYVYRYRSPESKPALITIGNAGNISVDFARERARFFSMQLAVGFDPRRAREHERLGSTETLRTVFERYACEFLSKRSTGYRRQVRRIFETYVFDLLGDDVLKDIRRDDIERLLARAGWYRAAKIRLRISAFLDWCASSRLIDGNPARGARLPLKSSSDWDGPDPDEPRQRLSVEELAVLWRSCEVLAPVWRCAFRLMIASAQRRGEVFEAHWNNVNLAQRRWSVHRHVIPISKLMAEQFLIAPEPGDGYIFGSERAPNLPVQGFSYPVRRLRQDPIVARILNRYPQWRLGDIRPSVGEQMLQLGVKPHVIEAISGRSRRRKAEMFFDIDYESYYYCEMVDALNAWGDRLQKVLNTLPSDGRWAKPASVANEDDEVVL